jgi:uncharacterized protein with NAD-binding domain and iron-sulfur cluster
MIAKKKCLIIGAGIAGLMAGKKLQDQGVDITILDTGRRCFRRSKGGGRGAFRSGCR